MKFLNRFVWLLVGVIVLSMLYALTAASGVTLTVNDRAYHFTLRSH